MFFQDSTLNQTFVVVQSFSCVRLCVIPWTAAGQASLFFTISWSLLKFMSIESVIPSNYLILCYPLLLLETDPSVFPNTSIFSNESALCIKWPKYQSFSISPSNEYSGLIYFRIDWFDLLAVMHEVAQLCLTLSDPMDCSLPCSSVHMIFQARGSSRPRD